MESFLIGYLQRSLDSRFFVNQLSAYDFYSSFQNCSYLLFYSLLFLISSQTHRKPKFQEFLFPSFDNFWEQKFQTGTQPPFVTQPSKFSVITTLVDSYLNA